MANRDARARTVVAPQTSRSTSPSGGDEVVISTTRTTLEPLAHGETHSPSSGTARWTHLRPSVGGSHTVHSTTLARPLMRYVRPAGVIVEDGESDLVVALPGCVGRRCAGRLPPRRATSTKSGRLDDEGMGHQVSRPSAAAANNRDRCRGAASGCATLPMRALAHTVRNRGES